MTRKHSLLAATLFWSKIYHTISLKLPLILFSHVSYFSVGFLSFYFSRLKFWSHGSIALCVLHSLPIQFCVTFAS